LVHFEKPLKDYVSAEITQLIAVRLILMGIQTNDILEPIAPLCSTKPSKPWNGMIKLHLKPPTTNRHQLLADKRIFALALDGELKIAKIAKGFTTTAYNDQLTVKIEGEVLKDELGSSIISEIVETSFRHEQEVEIFQIHKVTLESKAYLIMTTPEKKQKMLLHQVTCAGEILTPILVSQQCWIRNTSRKSEICDYIYNSLLSHLGHKRL
jgi:hypothetical protein